ncbi:MAG: hypothetical protein QOK25_1634 [Thermoleophilaceae bacterium]|jgi:hypothetical protein|nr:hypothetical protein [Thermoleophilaceae bacterium]
MDFSDSHHLRKMVAGACMVLAPLMFVVAFVISPKLETDAGPALNSAASHLDRFYAANLIATIGLVLVVPAVLGLMHMLRERRPVYSAIGGGLTMLGIMGALVGQGVSFVMWQMATDGVQPADVSALHGVLNDAGAYIPTYGVAFLACVGALIVGAGLYRAGVVDWWMALFFAAGAVCINVAFPAGVLGLAIVGAALMLVGLGSMGLMVLRESDAEWEHTPDYHGIRPAAGVS